MAAFAINMWHRLRIALRRLFRVLIVKQDSLIDESDTDEGCFDRCQALDGAVAFFTTQDGNTVVVDVTDHMRKALVFIHEHYGTARDDMHISDLLTLQNASGDPFFPLMHLRLSCVEAPSITDKVDYGVLMYHNEAYIDAFTNKDRCRLALGVLDDPTRNLPGRTIGYRVLSVHNAPSKDQEDFIKDLFTPFHAYSHSFETLMRINEAAHQINDKRTELALKHDRVETTAEEAKMNRYEKLVLYDMFVKIDLEPQPDRAPISCAVMDNVPSIRYVTLYS